MSAEFVLVLLFLTLLNTDSFGQDAAPKAPVKDVVEIETEIGVDQMKRSDVVSKPTIKPRAAYTEAKKTEPEKPVTSKPAADTVDDAFEHPSSVIANEVKQSQGEIASSASKKGVLAVTDSALSEPLPAKKIKNALTDVQVVEISASLRKLIEENESLKKELDQLDQQLKTVRGQQKLESNRVNEIAMERDALKKQNENIIALGAKSDQALVQLQDQLTEKETQYNQQIIVLQTELANALRANPVPPQTEQLAGESLGASPARARQSLDQIASPASGGLAMTKNSRSIAVDVASQPNVSSDDAQKQSEKVLMALDSVNREKAKLTRDEAKLHYNMGNTYFNEGDYSRAVAEYDRAVELSPEDANAHYNLAFVSGDFLNDPVTALQHYKMYLFLNPGAEDAQVVRQKMIEAEISVKADVHFQSNINKEVKQKKNEFNEATQF